ncbi:HEPN domain-containing protein [Picosynechococcus sp. PCC 11901]|uniref:HEPN domain-containing protein n=2 Tax=Picosynechococcus sp. PCC 11901 TaxID=2579791 RepID=UPI0010FC1425|nr:HEPN domain-containing protein [Picosynechococcus sp. PCC 11901]QCS49892.1 HEPN domain-containing protein [Picosynechococcus sp. PCC 11901]
MNCQQQNLMSKAAESLEAAKLLRDNQYFDYSVSRAYYTMFYLAEAFLEGEAKTFSSHAAVISAFGRDFAKLGKVPREFHRFFIDAQSLRQTGDYGKFQAISEYQANQQIENATKFLTFARDYFKEF